MRVALKVDVDTDRGTREGVPRLAADLLEFRVPACFLFSVGPDQTGRALRRIFRRGFLRKVTRTRVVSSYGWRTLLSGTLLPAPHIGRRNGALMRAVRDAGFEAGLHCYNHARWQDRLASMTKEAVAGEFAAARGEFRRIFGIEPRVAGAPGWQSNALSRRVYDEAGLLYSSDSRGTAPYFPRVDGCAFRTLEIPTTLPTLDELLGRPEIPERKIVGHYVGSLHPHGLNVFTLHAELEGMAHRRLFRDLLQAWLAHGVEFIRLEDHARELLARPASIPVCDQSMAPIDGRSGLVTTQGGEASSARVAQRGEASDQLSRKPGTQE